MWMNCSPLRLERLERSLVYFTQLMLPLGNVSLFPCMQSSGMSDLKDISCAVKFVARIVLYMLCIQVSNRCPREYLKAPITHGPKGPLQYIKIITFIIRCRAFCCTWCDHRLRLCGSD